MKRIELNDLTDDRYSDYLKDSSLLQGRADEIVLCYSSKDVVNILNECKKKHTKITIQGALTGICGGAVPDGGCVINMSQMNGIIGMTYNEGRDEFYLIVEPGLSLKDLNNLLKSRAMETSNWSAEDIEVYTRFQTAAAIFFPPDPTESTATIGGMVACDASGACSFKYGSTRNFVEGLRIVTLLQEEVYIKRGQYQYKDINKLFETKSLLPDWHRNAEDLKDVAGLYYKDEMDLIDLFIGSEGLFGVITEVELKLLNAPQVKMGLMLFLNEDNKLIEFINWLRNNMETAAIEYFDKKTLNLLGSFRDLKREIADLPEIADEYRGGLYLEFHLADEEGLEDILSQLFDNLNNFGINEEEQWLALEPSDFEKLKDFRHAVPECVNIRIGEQKLVTPEINKVGTDMAVPDIYLKDVLEMYREDIEDENLNSIIFGHIGDNHLHVNLLPKDFDSYSTSLQIVKSWADRVIAWGGTVTAEHGIGRLKKELLKQMISEKDLDSMRVIKKIIDPSGLINQGVLLDSESKGGFDGI